MTADIQALPPTDCIELPVESVDGHRAILLGRIPQRPRMRLLWVPALGVAARHYVALADALAARGIALFLHEWRGNGSSSLRPGREVDWGYRELLADIAASDAVARAATQGIAQVIGGHSLGGQLAGLHVGLHPDAASALWLVASGAPYFRAFPRPARWLLPLARGVMADWARTALSGRYAASGVDADIEAALHRFQGQVRAVVLADDWFAPASSVAFLLSKFGAARSETVVLDRAALGTRADHFAWMKHPAAVAAWLAP